ncbi:8-amino-7-oxononanoate synthase [Apiospora hydei]|uniref:8-amino-7-oxononanoate synthase n=1 Tax=Apiospora hydei TaxID=1337664 RepID=A0ABR1WBP1_9PEZI
MGLEATFETLLARRNDAGRLRQLTLNPAGAVDFSSNDYLSFAEDAGIQRTVLARLEHRLAATTTTTTTAARPVAAAAAAADVSTPNQNQPQDQDRRRILGSAGSRLLDGNSALAEGLEDKIAAFHRAPAALLFNSAYDANVGLLSCAPQAGDVVLLDEAIHASVHDGLRLSRATQCIPFSHASVVGGRRDGLDGSSSSSSTAQDLGAVLGLITAAGYPNAEEIRDGRSHVFVCVEGVYSMDGSVLNIVDLVNTVKKHLPRGNGYIIIDEAHSTGVLGPRGRGLVCQHGLEKDIWARVHGFGKAMGCAGGVVLCSPTTRAYLINYARTFIYTTSMTLTSLICIDAAYDHLAGGGSDEAHRHLRQLTDYAYQLLRDICSHYAPSSSSNLVRVSSDDPDSSSSGSPIMPIFTTKPRSLASFCQRRGYMVRPIVAPTVPVGTERVRLCLHAKNTFEQVHGLGDVIQQWIRGQQSAAAAKEGRREGVGLARSTNGVARLGKPRL